jgi:large repetitive protein
LDTLTGAATRIGSLGVTDANALVFGSNGALYSADVAGNFLTLNTTTGQATTVGQIGFGSAGDLAFVGGTLYLSDVGNQLVTVDPPPGKERWWEI